MKRILIAAVALCAVAYAVYAVWLPKPASVENAGNNPAAVFFVVIAALAACFSTTFILRSTKGGIQ